MVEATEPRRRRPVAAALLLTAADLYALAALAYLLLRVAVGEGWWPVVLADVFAHWLLLPAPLVLGAALLARGWRTAALAAVPALAYLWLFGGLLLPKGPPPPACAAGAAGCAELTVVTFNAEKTLPDMAAFAALLAEHDADIVALQELSDDFAAAIDGALAGAYPHRILHPKAAAGIGLLSRYPILEQERFFLESGGFPQLYALLDADGQPVAVYNVHPRSPLLRGEFRSRGVADMHEIVARVEAGPHPTLLVGDLNATDQSAEYRILREAGLQDAFREAGAGYGLTFPGSGWDAAPGVPPLIRIDYVWSSGEFETLSARVGPDFGSDHLPVIATLRLAHAAR